MMKLIPRTHTAAFHWINQVWAILEITPIDTAQLLAKMCGFNNWEELANAITSQKADGPFLILDRDAGDALDTPSNRAIVKRQRDLLSGRRPYTDEFIGEFLKTLNVLGLQKFSEDQSKMHVPLSGLLNQINDPESGEEMDIIQHILDSGDAPSLERPVDASQYLGFAKAMGWEIDLNTVVKNHTPYDASFYLIDGAEAQIPVFIFPLAAKPSDPDDLLAAGIRSKISTLADMADWNRVVVMWGECFVLTDTQENCIIFVGHLLDSGTWYEMLVNSRTDSVDSLFNLNKQAHLDMKGRREFMPYMIDTAFYAAQIYEKHIPIGSEK